MYEPFFFLKEKKPDIRLKIFYFTLEMSKEEKIKSAISHKIFRDTGKIISPERMDSTFQDYILDSATEKLIESGREFFKEFEQTVTFIDSIRNPFGIYKYMRDYANSHGKYIDRNGQVIPHEKLDRGDEEVLKSLDRYEPDDPNEYVIVITDHLSLLTPENGQTLGDAINTFSSNYCIRMRNRWGYIPVNVQQQAAAKEKVQYTFKGESIDESLVPSQDGLGDSKLTQRDCDVMLGLFAPHRYGIQKWEGFNIERLQDNFRELSVILNRRGTGFISVPLYFNGAVNYFKELPKIMQEKDYTDLHV
jgi:hypothetical protein